MVPTPIGSMPRYNGDDLWVARSGSPEVGPGLVEVEGGVPRLTPTL